MNHKNGKDYLWEATLITPYVDHINEDTTDHGVSVDGVTLKDGGALTITGGTNTFNVTNGTASLDVAAGTAVNIDKSLTVDGQATTITGAGQANTLTLNESLTVGDGYSGTVTFSAASKTLTVSDTSAINQDVSTSAGPAWDHVHTASIIAPAASLIIKPTTDATTAIQIADKDGNAILTVDTTNNKIEKMIELDYFAAGLAAAIDGIGVLGKEIENIRLRVLATGQVTITNSNTGNPHWLMATALTTNVSLPYSLPNANYTVLVEIEDADFKERVGEIKISSKAVNGFTITVTGNTNNIDLRWTVVDPNYWVR